MVRSCAVLVLVGCSHATPPASPAPEPRPLPLSPDAAVAPPVAVSDAAPVVPEDPALTCVDEDVATCRWVEMWRRHLTEDHALPPDWIAAHVKLDKIDRSTMTPETQLIFKFTITVDWVTIQDDEWIQIGEPSGQLSTEDQIRKRFAASKLNIKPFKVALTHAKARALLARCHGSEEGSAVIMDDKTVVLRGIIGDARDGRLCWSTEVNLETGRGGTCESGVCVMY